MLKKHKSANSNARFKHLFKCLLRVTIGGLFTYMGYEQFRNPSLIISQISSLNLPFSGILSWLVIITQLLCGAFLIVGFLSSLVSLPLMVIMITAFALHVKSGLNLNTWALTIIFLCLGIFSTSGPGQWSIDLKIQH